MSSKNQVSTCKMLLYILIGIVTILSSIVLIRRKPKHTTRPPGTKEVPQVEGAIPIAGHGIAFSQDIIGFVRKSYQKYGKIFRLQIFNKNMIVVCDRTMNDEFFKATEDSMSLYDVLGNLYFSDAFSDDPTTLPLIIRMVKKTITIRFDEFVPKIMDEANRMIKRLKGKCCVKNTDVDLTGELIHFVACTSARCFLSVELTDEIFDILMKFTHLLNRIVVLTYFFPKPLLRLILNPFLTRHRKKITAFMDPEIEKYRHDPKKTDSLVIRACVDAVDDVTDKPLTNQQIGDIIVCLLYVSSENTALGLSASIINLTMSQEYWDKVKAESQKYLSTNDIKSLYNSPILNACVMESARMNSHIFALNRRPRSREATLGDYHVGDADCVALCEPMLMNYDCADEVFSTPSFIIQEDL